MRRRIVVTIPVRNEAERIGGCLTAMLSQTVPADDVVLLLNNCEDATHALARACQRRHPNVHLVERQLVGDFASAGEARRLALHYAAGLAGDGVLLTSDADALVPPGWIEANLIEMAKGAAVVCGRAVIDHAEMTSLPVELQRQEEAQTTCLALLDEIAALTDPESDDPWPRHADESGASIALTVAAFRRAGGAPVISWGEDRALIARLRLVDVAIRHAPHIVVTVSGRLSGRARHGMADALRRRLESLEEWADERLEPASGAYRRALARAAVRRVWAGEDGVMTLANELLVSPAGMEAALAQPFFGAAWAQIETLSPVMGYRRVAMADLPRETARARRLLAQLRPARFAPHAGSASLAWDSAGVG